MQVGLDINLLFDFKIDSVNYYTLDSLIFSIRIMIITVRREWNYIFQRIYEDEDDNTDMLNEK